MNSMISAFNRIEGQVRGVKKMYEEGRDCAQIAQQIAAIQNALKRVGKELLTAEACQGMNDKTKQAKLEKIVESLMKLG